jgi:hypothetical protein
VGAHNRTPDGDPLISYGEPQFAGLPRDGKLGKRERDYIQVNLEEVNVRRTAAGHPAIDLNIPTDALLRVAMDHAQESRVRAARDHQAHNRAEQEEVCRRYGANSLWIVPLAGRQLLEWQARARDSPPGGQVQVGQALRS